MKATKTELLEEKIMIDTKSHQMKKYKRPLKV